MEPWHIGVAANVIVTVGYLAIAGHVLLGVARARQWRSNPLALATGTIFLSCGVGHGLHVAHALPPLAGLEPASAAASRTLLGSWHVWAVDGATAAIAVWYWSLRGRFPALVRGAALFEDMRVRQRQALEIHDSVVQGLVKARLAEDVGDRDAARAHLDETLAASRRIMGDLLGSVTEARTVRPGELRRGSEAPP